jgi:hypothetical protein
MRQREISKSVLNAEWLKTFQLTPRKLVQILFRPTLQD